MGWVDDIFGWHDAFGNLSYVLIAVSYYLTRMLWLRALAVLGLSLEILYFHFSGGHLNTGIGWNLVFIAINLIQLWRLVQDARKGHFGPEHELLRRGILAGLDDAQLGRLFRMGSWRDLAVGTPLTHEGRKVPELYLLCTGYAEVEVEGAVVARLAPGSFVGEIAFLSGSTATATVRVQEAARIFAFDTARLRKLIAHDEQIAAVMHRSVGQDLANKLRRSTHGEIPRVA